MTKVHMDPVLEQVGRKFNKFYTGLGVRGITLAARIDNSVPPEVVIMPSSSGFRHGQDVVAWREPIIATTGIYKVKAWVLDDPDCPPEIREKYSYLIGCTEAIACELVIVYRFQGDNDGDMFAFCGIPALVEAYKEHSFYIFDKDELFLIEGGKKRGSRATTPIHEVLVGLGRDYRGPIGPQTRAQQVGLTVQNRGVTAGFMRAMQSKYMGLPSSAILAFIRSCTATTLRISATPLSISF